MRTARGDPSRGATAARAVASPPVFTLRNDGNVPPHLSKYARYISKFSSSPVSEWIPDPLLLELLWHLRAFWSCASSPRKVVCLRIRGKSNERVFKISFRGSQTPISRVEIQLNTERRLGILMNERGLGRNDRARASCLFLFPLPKLGTGTGITAPSGSVQVLKRVRSAVGRAGQVGIL